MSDPSSGIPIEQQADERNDNRKKQPRHRHPIHGPCRNCTHPTHKPHRTRNHQQGNEVVFQNRHPPSRLMLRRFGKLHDRKNPAGKHNHHKRAADQIRSAACPKNRPDRRIKKRHDPKRQQNQTLRIANKPPTRRQFRRQHLHFSALGTTGIVAGKPGNSGRTLRADSVNGRPTALTG